MRTMISICSFLLFLSCNEVKKKRDRQILEVRKALIPPTIDGKATENSWSQATWRALDQNWMGPPYDYQDFYGRYKVLWDEDALYILLEVVDDVLYDQNKNPLKLWWNDDCTKIFIDEDNSGGLHQYNHNAFAYHISLDGDVVDLGRDKQPKLYNDHIASKRTTVDNLSTWEFRLKVYDSGFKENQGYNPVRLEKGKKIGFAMAYCDNDGSTEMENAIGSIFISGEDKNQAWIDADIFGTLVLKE